MKHSFKPEVLDLLRCPTCGVGNRLSSNGNGHMVCSGCNVEYPIGKGYLNLYPDYQESVTPIQHLCQSAPMIAIYDKIWRPFGYFFTSSRSFPEDLDRITELMDPEQCQTVLDLACGPGNFTRNIARYGKETKVVGFDLADRMLERAAELSTAPEYSNVCFMRGNALEMPFESESFDAVICCAALQLFTNYDRALSEIARVLKPGGAFVCQTIATEDTPPLWLRMADQIMKFGYFKMRDLKAQLDRLELDITVEESSKVSYIFRAVKRESARILDAELETASSQR